MRTTRISLLPLLLAQLSASPLTAEEFSTKIIDGLGRPVPGVVVDVHWLKEGADGEVRKAGLVKLRTDKNGTARGSFDEKSLPPGERAWVELIKEGNSGYSSDG